MNTFALSKKRFGRRLQPFTGLRPVTLVQLLVTCDRHAGRGQRWIKHAASDCTSLFRLNALSVSELALMQGALGTGAGASAHSVPNASLPTAKCQVMSALWVIGRHAEGDGRFKWLQIMQVSAHYLFT